MSTEKNDWAMPSDPFQKPTARGLTAVEYAAIHLRVPKSGTAWIDDMIRESLRDRFAGHSLAGLMANSKWSGNHGGYASAAYDQAQVMLAEKANREGKNESV